MKRRFLGDSEEENEVERGKNEVERWRKCLHFAGSERGRELAYCSH